MRMNRFMPACSYLLLGNYQCCPARPKPTQAIRYIKLANTLRAVEKSDESISLLKRALPLARSDNLYWDAVTNELLGLSYSDLRDSTTAIQYLDRARDQYLKLKYVASAWGVNEIVRNLSNKNLYAGIQIGTSTIKLAILKTRYETDFYKKDIKTTVDIANPAVTFFADARARISRTGCAENMPGFHPAVQHSQRTRFHCVEQRRSGRTGQKPRPAGKNSTISCRVCCRTATLKSIQP